MSTFRRFLSWFRRAKRTQDHSPSSGLLREFVYLDDVSVYSILASRKGTIPTQVTESRTVTKGSEVGSEIGIAMAGAHAKVGSKLEGSQLEGSQILRKAIVQTSFKELHDIERHTLAFPTPKADDVPAVQKVSDIEERMDELTRGAWLIDPLLLRRGELTELEVELEADPIFRMTSIITTLRELVENNERLFGQEVASHLPEMRSMARVLEGLLVGLVPFRGRLVDYSWVQISDREVLIHRLLLNQLSTSARPETFPVLLVGVAQRDLFWKDIRRVLFSRALYTVFCRIAVTGLASKWHPVKIADVLEGIVPQFDDLVRDFGRRANDAVSGATQSGSTSTGDNVTAWRAFLTEYVELLVGNHGRSLHPTAIEGLVGKLSFESDWLGSVDGRRAVFSSATQLVDEELGVKTCGEVALRIRTTVMENAGIGNTLAKKGQQEERIENAPSLSQRERFLDVEIIAIYW